MPAQIPPPSDRPVVLDVSRLVWRIWTGRLPTGIDKVCLAYLDRFAGRSLAMVQKGQLRLILDEARSDRLFALLARGGPTFRRRLVAVLARALVTPHRGPTAGKIYLNVGHTGLDAEDLGAWLAQEGLRPVFLIHDLIPITHPQFCREGEDRRHRHRIRHALQAAAGIVVNSEDTRLQLARFASDNGLSLPPTSVAWLGTDPAEPAPMPAGTERPYFVVIGTIEARKNHFLLLRIWRRLATRLGQKAPLLVVIGQRGWEADTAFAMLDQARRDGGPVLELGRCSDAELAAWLRSARALLMPSEVEGFGLPAIEALRAGVPVIASDLAVYREVAGSIPLYLSAHDEQGWESAILDFCETSGERDRQLAALKSFTAPTWEEHFDRVERFLGDLA